ncbi:MAG: CcdB family protein [Pseudomonadales bacterium]|nr:CcdB family protein [Pseudomonadales bacterium]
MGQFTLYENQSPDSKESYPYFVDVQNDLLDALNTRLVIPLTASKNMGDTNIGNLCPTVDFDGNQLVLLTHQMTNVPISALKSDVGSLEQLRDEIIAAIDFLVTGI